MGTGTNKRPSGGQTPWKTVPTPWHAKLDNIFTAGLIIAATAAHHELTVVTRDRTHYPKARAPVINLWEQ